VRVAVTGAGGLLGQAIAMTGAEAGHDVYALDRDALDITQSGRVNATFSDLRPHVVINCAAYTDVDGAETDAAAAFRVNAEAARDVAEAADRCGAIIVYPSTDYVFDGSGDVPYRTDGATAPVNTYGLSKLQGETHVRTVARHLVVRTSWLYGAGGRNFVTTILERASSKKRLEVVDDQRGAPTWSVHLARMIFSLLDRNAPSGVYHATNMGAATWFEFAQRILEAAGVDSAVLPVMSSTASGKARRPRYSVLDCSTTYAITGAPPCWEDALNAALPLMA
jgi:dTDP-4-dehydrorhamnose reductase